MCGRQKIMRFVVGYVVIMTLPACSPGADGESADAMQMRDVWTGPDVREEVADALLADPSATDRGLPDSREVPAADHWDRTADAATDVSRADAADLPGEVG